MAVTPTSARVYDCPLLNHTMLSTPAADNSTSLSCPSCQIHDIREWFVPSEPYSRPMRKDSLDWIAILKNKPCPFCKLIVKTLCQDPGFIEAVTGGQPAKVSVYARAVGKVTWRESDCSENREPCDATTSSHSGWRLENGGITRCARRIDVSAEINRRSWWGVIRASGHDATKKNRLLLARPMPGDQVDVKRVEFWMAACEAYHGTTHLPTVWDDVNLAGVLMIDVRTRCIVPAPAGMPVSGSQLLLGQPRGDRASKTD
jgi:hypothetical protein